MAGMFTIDSHPALVLFDSGASHSFMSMGFVERHNLPVMATVRLNGRLAYLNTV